MNTATAGPRARRERLEPGTSGSKSWLSHGALSLPTIAVALLPKVVCPLCLPAYAALFGALGLGFLLTGPWLLPMTAAFLGSTLLGLAWTVHRSGRGWGPVGWAGAAAAAILLGKFALASAVLSALGLAGLCCACVWNLWAQRRAARCAAAPAAAPQDKSVAFVSGTFARCGLDARGADESASQLRALE